MRRIKHLFVTRLITGVGLAISLVITVIFMLLLGLNPKSIAILAILITFVVVFILFFITFSISLIPCVKKFDCNGKVYYAFKGNFIVELFEENKLLKRFPNFFVAPDIEYVDENGNKVFVEFGEFRGIKFSVNGEKIKPMPIKRKHNNEKKDENS